MNKDPQLIGTINDDDEIEDFSEESDVELEFQPSKRKCNQENDFNSDFQFVSSIEEYNKDTWNDLSKYIKRKAKTKTDDKIKKARKEVIKIKDDDDNDNDNDSDKSDASISDDELKDDILKVKEKKKKEFEFFDENIETNKEDNTSFYQMNLSRPLLKAITELKFVHPTPIQSATIPVALLGKDICGCAATGTGKTAAYMLPTLERLLYRPAGPTKTRVLVLVPTRELGVQVYQVSKQLCQYTDIQIALSVGGLDLKVQETMLRKNPDIVIATPGRLIDHLKSCPTFSLDSIEILILDEADRMLDEYFAEQMKEIIKSCSRTRQTMLFSATMTDDVENLAAVSLNKPVRLFVDSNVKVAFNLRQEFIRIRQDKEMDREAILSALICRTFKKNCMIFVQTKKQAHRLHILLGLLGIKVGELHGNLTQTQRLDALEKFKIKEFDVLVSTDVAARGLDIEGVQTVINFIMPATIQHYIHRVGRTARAGRAGVSVSLAGEQDRKIVKEIIKKAKGTIKSRVIPLDILNKYKIKLEKLEEQIQKILQEEYEERLLAKTENQINKTEKLLKGAKQEDRPWFQTKKQRKDEKKRLSLKDNDKKVKKNNKKSKEPVQIELEKVAMLKAKIAKKKSKLGKINTVREDVIRKPKKLKKKSHFNDLWDFSQKNARKLRHQANGNNKGNKKKQSGKAFGKPKQKKNF